MNTPQRPKLRPIEAVPVRDGRRVLVQIYDPARISDKLLVVPREMLFLLSLLDGTNTVADIQAAIAKRFGELVLSEHIQHVVGQLDEALMLDSDHFRAKFAEQTRAFRRSPVRLPASAGGAYPAEPGELASLLDAWLEAAPTTASPSDDRPLAGVVAPHIDFERGGPSYGIAYRPVADGCDAELFVILGTAHFARKAAYILTRKAFQTPLGTMPTQVELVNALARRYRRRPFAEELVHRNEHSIEFQVVCLQRALRGRSGAVWMLPVLCGSFGEKVGEGASPRDVPEIADFMGALRDVVSDSGMRACWVAGADMSHVGPAFGHDFELTPQVMADVERADRAMLAHVEALDPDAFFGSVYADGNARNVCGAAAVYTLLAAAEPAACRLLDYRQATDYALGRAVTFAAMALYG